MTPTASVGEVIPRASLIFSNSLGGRQTSERLSYSQLQYITGKKARLTSAEGEVYEAQSKKAPDVDSIAFSLMCATASQEYCISEELTWASEFRDY